MYFGGDETKFLFSNANSSKGIDQNVTSTQLLFIILEIMPIWPACIIKISLFSVFDLKSNWIVTSSPTWNRVSYLVCDAKFWTELTPNSAFSYIFQIVFILITSFSFSDILSSYVLGSKENNGKKCSFLM